MANVKNEEWLNQRISYIKSLKSPNEQQRLIVLWSEKENLEPAEEKKLALLIRAERIQQRAAESRVKVNAVLNADKKVAAKAERKARDHELYKSAGLMVLAGLVDKETGKPVTDVAALVGALAGLNELPRDNPKWQEWKRRGNELLNSGSPKTLRMT